HLTAVDTDVPGTTDTDETLDGDGDDRISNIDLPGDKDAFRVELQEGARYEFTLNGEGAHPLHDPVLTLSNSSDEVVRTDDNSGPGLNSRILFTAPAGDVYYLRAAGKGRSTGGYKIALTRLSAPSVNAPVPPSNPEPEATPTPHAPMPPATPEATPTPSAP